MAEVNLISSDGLRFSIPAEAVKFSTFIDEIMANKYPPPANQPKRCALIRNFVAFRGHQMVADGAAVELYKVFKENPANNNPPESHHVFIRKHKGNTLGNIVYFLSQQTIPDEAKKKKLNAGFLNGPFVNLAELFATALAAHDLGIKVLEDLMCERIAHRIGNCPRELVRKEFESDTDLTSEQVAFTKARYPWAFEGGDRNAPPAPPPSPSE